MRLASVLLARALAFVESFDLNPRGAVFYPDLVRGMVEKFGFQKFPQKLEDFDESKGVEFAGGRWGNTTVEALTIYRNGLILDTRASTAESERILAEGLAWASSTFGLEYHPEMVTRRAYLSYLCFYSDFAILSKASSPASRLAERIHAAVSEITGDETPWEPTILTLYSDYLPRKPVFAPFTIQRRAETAFSENKFYSEAPLPTNLHLALLEQFEADVSAS